MKALIASGISDPISATRSGSSSFVTSTWPESYAEYPFVLIGARFGSTTRMGMQSEIMSVPVQMTIQIVTTKMSDKDQLSGSIFHLLRTCQYDINSVANTGSGTNLERMYDFRLVNNFDRDEIGKRGEHRKIMEIEYDIVAA